MGTLGIGEGGHRRTPAAYGQNVLMVHNWFNDRPSFNGPAWSIASEWFAYLLAPLLFLLVARVVRARTSVLLAALSYAAMLTVFAVFALPNGNLEHMFYVRIMGEFIAGMFLCLAWVRGGLTLGRLAPLLPAVVLVVALVPAVASSDYWMAPALGLVVAVVAGAGGWVGSWLSTSVMVAAGEASYCLYMTHYLMRPVVTWLREWGDDAWWSAGLAVAALVLALGGAAWLMHVLVERPARQLLHARKRAPVGPFGAGRRGLTERGKLGGLATSRLLPGLLHLGRQGRDVVASTVESTRTASRRGAPPGATASHSSVVPASEGSHCPGSSRSSASPSASSLTPMSSDRTTRRTCCR